MNPSLSRSGVLRVLTDLLDQEFTAARGRSLTDYPTGDPGDPGTINLGVEGLALDSMEFLTIGGVVNEFFHLHESGVEDYLLRRRTLAGWAEIIEHALAEGVTSVTFRTGGSTGTPTPVTHSWSSLNQEIDFLAELFGGRRRILSTVPAHHIYGFLFTVLLPDRLGLPVLRFPWERTREVAEVLAPGDLVVSHPAIWQYLSRSNRRWSPGVYGVSSTAPLPEQLHRELREHGIEELFEIYGSTETGGVGYRRHPGEPFTLFPYFVSGAGEGDLRRLDADGAEGAAADGTADGRGAGATGEPVTLMDSLQWVAERQFRPTGRKDRTVQVGGENVSLDHVEAVIGELPGVEEVAVRLNGQGPAARLKAFVVPEAGREPTESQLREGVAKRLRPVARPLSFTIGRELPRTPLGKLTDWPV